MRKAPKFDCLGLSKYYLDGSVSSSFWHILPSNKDRISNPLMSLLLWNYATTSNIRMIITMVSILSIVFKVVLI